MNVSEFADKHGITLGLIAGTGVDGRLRVELHRTGTLGFVGLIAWTETHNPTVTDILTALSGAAADVEMAIDAKDWGRYAGVEADAKLHEQYRIAKDQARRLEQWLPVGAYETLMWELESINGI